MFNSLHGFGVKILLFKGLLPWPLSGSIDHNVIGGTQTIVNLFRINCFCVLTFTAVICLIYSTCETYHITHKNVADISFNTCIIVFWSMFQRWPLLQERLVWCQGTFYVQHPSDWQNIGNQDTRNKLVCVMYCLYHDMKPNTGHRCHILFI